MRNRTLHRRWRYRLHRIRANPRLQFQYMAGILAFVTFVGGATPFVLPLFAAWAVLFFTERNPRAFLDALGFGAPVAEYRGELLCIYGDLFYARPYLFRALLASRDIESFVINEHIGSIVWKVARAAGGVRLYVAKEDYAAADRAIREAANEHSAEATVCPRCASPDVEFRPYYLGLATFSAITAVLIPIPDNRYVCLDCRKRWRLRPS